MTGFSCEQCSFPPFRFIHVMWTAAQFEILDHALTAIPIRLYVMEFEKASLRAPAVDPHKRALTAIALPHPPAHVRGNVTRTPLRDSQYRSWPIRRRELLLLQLAHEHLQRSIDDDRQVASWKGMAQQVLRATEHRMRLGRQGDLQFVELRRERGHDR